MRILIVCISIFIVSHASACTHYLCDITNPENVKPNEFVCAKKTYDTAGISTMHFSKDQCPNSYLCDYSFTDSTDKCITNYQYYLAAGENCTYPEECYSGNCKNNKCEGAVETTECTFDIECGAGLGCMSSTCKILAKLNENCGETAKCQSYLICNMGKCVEPGSISSGTNTEVSAPLACASMFMAQNKDLKKVCVAGPHLEGYNPKGPSICTESNLTCYYSYSVSDQKASYMGACDCGRGSGDLQYCQPGKGDLQSDVKIFVEYLNKKKPDCHIAKPFFCSNLYWDNETKMAYSAYMNISQQYMFDQLETCIKKLEHKYFEGVEIYIWNQSQPINGNNGSNGSAMFVAHPIAMSFWATMAVIIGVALILPF